LKRAFVEVFLSLLLEKLVGCVTEVYGSKLFAWKIAFPKELFGESLRLTI